MSYIDDNLLNDEKVLIKAKVHWSIFIVPIFIILFGLLFVTGNTVGFGCFVIFLGIIRAVMAWIYTYSTELAVTNKKIIAKFGLISRDTIELQHDKLESLKVNQGILGRMFNCGSISVMGSGGSKAPIKYIDDPLAFRKAALEACEQNK